MFSLFCFSLLLGSVLGSVIPQNEPEDLSNLKLLTVICRHGDRTPITLYPNDPNQNYTYKEGRGQLTNLGKLQHYKVGQYLRERYGSFITTHPQEITVKSSAKDRTIMSALVNLAGFYSPDEEHTFTEDLAWQPIPVFTNPPKGDGLLYEGAECPEAKAEQKRIRDSPEGEEYRNQFTELFEHVTLHSGMEVNDWDSAADIFSTLRIERSHGLIIPEWVDEDETYEKLEQITHDSFRLSYNTTKIQRLRGGLVIGETVNNMKKKESGGPDENKKVYFYSTHDVNIAAILNALGVFNGRAPPFSATILIEYHSPPSLVRVYYSNSTTPETGHQAVHLLPLPGCGTTCTLDEFVELTLPVIPYNWRVECGLEEPSNSGTLKPALSIISYIPVLLIWVLLYAT